MARPQPDSRRTYDSSGRRARAAELRRHVIEQAHDLFVAHGFGGTTVADIARAAGVSAPTVFASFGSKAGVLKACIDVALAGDDDDTPVAERPLAQWVYETDDAAELLRRYAVMMATLASRAGPVYDVLVRAAGAEPELGALLADFEQQRLRASSMVAHAIAERGALPPGRSVDDARDAIWVLNAPELYVTLTRSRRWSTRRYTAWAADALIKLVLGPPDPGTPPTPPRPTPRR